jgi:hypothetical protein
MVAQRNVELRAAYQPKVVVPSAVGLPLNQA